MAIRKSVLSRPTRLSSTKRASIFDKTAEKVTKNYFHPAFNGTEWPRQARESRDRIVATEDPEQFELAMHALFAAWGQAIQGFSINPSVVYRGVWPSAPAFARSRRMAQHGGWRKMSTKPAPRIRRASGRST